METWLDVVNDIHAIPFNSMPSLRAKLEIVVDLKAATGQMYQAVSAAVSLKKQRLLR